MGAVEGDQFMCSFQLCTNPPKKNWTVFSITNWINCFITTLVANANRSFLPVQKQKSTVLSLQCFFSFCLIIFCETFCAHLSLSIEKTPFWHLICIPWPDRPSCAIVLLRSSLWIQREKKGLYFLSLALEFPYTSHLTTNNMPDMLSKALVCWCSNLSSAPQQALILHNYKLMTPGHDKYFWLEDPCMM